MPHLALLTAGSRVFHGKILGTPAVAERDACGEAASAFVPVTGASIAAMIATIAIRARALFIVSSISAVAATRP